MSSYYSSAELAEQQRARMRQELSEHLAQLKRQMLVRRANEAQLMPAERIHLTVAAQDGDSNDYGRDLAVGGIAERLASSSDEGREQPAALDFSSLLSAGSGVPGRLERELAEWLRRAEERPILTEEDERSKTRLFAELARLLKEETDIEDKLCAVRQRVSAYLQTAPSLRAEDRERIFSESVEYRALCELLGEEPTERLPERIAQENAHLRARELKRREDAFILETLTSILRELGCRVKDEAVLEKTEGILFAVEGHPLCDVFVGTDGRGILFEPVGDEREGPLERQREIARSADSICSMYEKLEKMAAERGVLLRRVYAEPFSSADMYVRADVGAANAKKRGHRASGKKARERSSEG